MVRLSIRRSLLHLKHKIAASRKIPFRKHLENATSSVPGILRRPPPWRVADQEIGKQPFGPAGAHGVYVRHRPNQLPLCANVLASHGFRTAYFAVLFGCGSAFMAGSWNLNREAIASVAKAICRRRRVPTFQRASAIAIPFPCLGSNFSIPGAFGELSVQNSTRRHQRRSNDDAARERWIMVIPPRRSYCGVSSACLGAETVHRRAQPLIT